MAVTACTGAPAEGSASPSAPAASGAGEGTIKVGAILPLTGDGAAYGPGMEVAARAAIDEVNKAGGVMGRNLELLVEDAATNADQGVRAANKLIDVNHVNAIIGTWASSVTLAVAPLTIQANIIEMNVSGSPEISDLDDNGTVFRANATDAALGATVAKQFYADGAKTMTVMTNNAAGTIGLAQAVRDAFTKAGGTVKDFIEYAEKQQSYATEVNRAVGTNPDLFFLSCYTPDGTQIIKAAFEAGATAKIAGPAWCLNGQLASAVGADVVEGDMGVDLVPVKESKAYQRLSEAYQESTGNDVFDNVYAVHVYDSVLLLALAMQKAQSTAGDEAGKAMTGISKAPGDKVESYADGLAALQANKDIDYDGASGPIDFNDAGDMAPFAGILTFHDGKPELTKTFSGSGE
jgi:branched-chain amino acid transport system substrate-binding protein